MTKNIPMPIGKSRPNKMVFSKMLNKKEFLGIQMFSRR